MTNDTKGLTIKWEPSGRNGAVQITARLCGEVVALERLDLAKSKARAAFVKGLQVKVPSVSPDDIEARLLEIAIELSDRSKPAPISSNGPAELDTTSIVRPERFITPDVSGLAIPMMTMNGESLVGKWSLFLRWTNGKRSWQQLSRSVELSDGRRLWIHPTPGEPTPSTPAGWSQNARQRWLDNESAPNPVDVFRAILERLNHFLDLPSEHAPGIVSTLALWSMLTYCYRAWPAVPYLYVGGPLGSGKSRVFDLLGQLAFRPLMSASMSAAALFRTLHAQGGTVLLDEAERLRDTKSPDVQELLSMLLAGYKRGGQATRLEAFGDSFRMISFDVFAPKALACIAGLPPALASRCITLSMFRAAPGSQKPRRRLDAEPQRWQAIRDDLHAVALEYGPDWLDLANRTDVCPRMAGRDFELWQPMLALAAWLEDHGAKGLLAIMLEHAERNIDSGIDDATPEADETLLRLLAEAFRAGERLEPQQLLSRAQANDAATFKHWQASGVSRRLKSYGIKAGKSNGQRLYKDLTEESFQRIQTSYGIDLGAPGDATDT